MTVSLFSTTVTVVDDLPETGLRIMALVSRLLLISSLVSTALERKREAKKVDADVSSFHATAGASQRSVQVVDINTLLREQSR